jgi:cholesterol transport system auxiliary component
MNGSRARRRALLLGVPAAGLLAAGGCGSLGLDRPTPTWYVLDDPEAAPGTAPGGARIDKVLLVAAVQASAFDESTMLAFGRTADTRAHYQFAGWTERPARRLGELVERRLAARGRFAAVGQTTSGLRGDLVLQLSLDHLYHDLSTTPGQARIAVRAELLQWRERRLLARRRFERSEPVAQEAADAAVRGLQRATVSLLDELSAWVEAAAAG